MKVVVVESPAKAKTINKYLGKDYKVLASYGHVRDLPSKDGSVDPNNHFQMIWELDARGQKQISEISKAVKESEALILATDPDREGEAISWHVKEVLEAKKLLKNKPISRIVFHEVTAPAIQQALNNPRNLDGGLIQAYLARRALDYLVGFTLSPILWRKLPGSRSAGRVQSVALRLITDRESEIEKFVSQEYWSVIGIFKTDKNQLFEAKLITLDGKKLDKFDLPTQKEAERAVSLSQAQAYSIATIEEKQVKRHPTAPFITSTLQQEASRKLGFTAKKTMQIAQRLYEGITLGKETVGLITYMRTDSTNVAQEALMATRTYIQNHFGKNYLPGSPRAYKSKAKNAQEAHEAIRPTDVMRTPESLKSAIDVDQFKLYDLIWKRLVASQMESALFNQCTINLISTDTKIEFRTTGSTLLFDGFLKLYEEGRDTEADEKEQRLPAVKANDPVHLETVTPFQHFTQPPARYTEASLVKKLEELGIGRPSTYASITSTLLDRGYVKLEKRQLIPESRGRVVTSFLVAYFPKYLEYDFTAHLEEELDEIAEGKINWEKSLQTFWIEFKKAIDEAATLKISDVIDYLNTELEAYLFSKTSTGPDPRRCPACDIGRLSLKLGKFGAFIGCSNYPTCRHVSRLSGETSQEDGEEKNSENAPASSKPFEPLVLGKDPKTDLEVTIRKGPYGFYLQWGEAQGKEKPKRIALPRHLKSGEVTLSEALTLGSLPKPLGLNPHTGEEITLGLGRFGPYLKYQGKFTSIPKDLDFLEISLDQALRLLESAPVKKGTFKKTVRKKVK